MSPLLIRPGLEIPEGELSFSAVRAGGPGGQNVNKVASKVVLRFDLASTRVLSGAVRMRLASLFSKRLDAEGAVLVTSQLTRDQSRNLDDAREKLRQMILAALVVLPPRVATKPSRRMKARRVADKRAVGEKKRARGDGSRSAD